MIAAERLITKMRKRRRNIFLVDLLRKGYGGLYKATTKEERKKRKIKRRERSDQIYLREEMLTQGKGYLQ